MTALDLFGALPNITGHSESGLWSLTTLQTSGGTRIAPPFDGGAGENRTPNLRIDSALFYH